MQTSKTEREYGGGRRWWTRERREAGWGGGGGGSGEGLKKLSHRSRVFERARPTPSCSCLPPTACNFLAKALMRGLARDGRSPRTSREREREREGLDSLSVLSHAPFSSPLLPTRFCSLLFSSRFPPPSSPSFLPLHTSLPPSRASSSLSSEGSLHGGGVHEPCAPRGTATVYLNSDLRSDTGLKLAKEVSRCLCIQDTAPPSNPFRSQRRNDATVRPAFHGNHHSRVLREGAAVEKLFSPRKLEPIFSVLCVYVRVCVELIRRNGPIMG